VVYLTGGITIAQADAQSASLLSSKVSARRLAPRWIASHDSLILAESRDYRMDTKLAKISHVSQVLSCVFSAIMLAIIVWPLVRPEQRGYGSLWHAGMTVYWPLALLALCIVGAAALQLASVLVARIARSVYQLCPLRGRAILTMKTARDRLEP
jgi:hypothetical protein